MDLPQIICRPESPGHETAAKRSSALTVLDFSFLPQTLPYD